MSVIKKIVGTLECKFGGRARWNGDRRKGQPFLTLFYWLTVYTSAGWCRSLFGLNFVIGCFLHSFSSSYDRVPSHYFYRGERLSRDVFLGSTHAQWFPVLPCSGLALTYFIMSYICIYCFAQQIWGNICSIVNKSVDVREPVISHIFWFFLPQFY